jgi:hypothetical protein
VKQIDNYINHVLIVLDKSGSMQRLEDVVIRVFDAEIKSLAERSQELDQETRVTVFQFDTKVECLVYDKDVLRLPSLREVFRVGRSRTALIDAVCQSVEELQETPERYGDHAFLGYVLTDGQENNSRRGARDIQRLFQDLPDNWTLGILVPDQNGVHEAKRFGFPADNVAVWSTTPRGVEEAGRRIRKVTDEFMTGRTRGIRKVTTGLWQMDTSRLTDRNVHRNLVCLEPSAYRTFPVRQREEIRDFVERRARIHYTKGCAFYQMTKTETIQPQKQVCVRDKGTDEVFAGAAARQLLGLPDSRIKVTPGAMTNFDIFVQSTSVNRKLVPGTDVLVMR